MKIRFSDPAANVALFAAAAPVVGGNVHRAARLFVAGDYPDRGVTVSAADVEGIAARFRDGGSKPVPILTEHASGLLHDPLGEVVALSVQDGELFGMLCFSEATDRHLRERGITAVSVALVEVAEGEYALKEVSMTEAPRVRTARILPLSAAGVPEKVASFRAAGRVTPAMEGPLTDLLTAAEGLDATDPDVLCFADGTPVRIGAAVAALLAALPVVLPRGGAVPAAAPQSAPSSGGNGGSITCALAAGLGIDPARLAAAVSERNQSSWRH